MHKVMVFIGCLLFAIGPVFSSHHNIAPQDRFHLVIRLQDDPNGPTWRSKLVQQAQAPFNPLEPYQVVPLDEIATALRLLDANLDLAYFQATYGGTVQAVYQSQVLLNSFGPEYQQLKWYLKGQDPKATSLSIPYGAYLAYPAELDLFTSLLSLEFFSYKGLAYMHGNSKLAPSTHPTPLPYFLLFATHPVLKKIANLKFGLFTIPNFPVGWSNGLTNLSQLDVRDLVDDVIFPELSTLTRLETLSLRDSITKIPDSFSALQILTCLNLSDNTLTDLPPSFGQLTSLTDLDLSRNGTAAAPLKPLPAIFAQLTRLKTLNLSWNGYKSPAFPFDCKLGVLPQLTTLDLSGNRELTVLPEGIGYLTSLQELDLSDIDVIASLPDSLVKLTTLSTLKVGKLNDYLSDQLYGMNQLTSLSMGYWYYIEGLTKLVNLRDLSMEYVDPEQFSYVVLTQLQSLKLVCDGNTNFPDWLGTCISLRNLDLWDYLSSANNPHDMSLWTQLQSLSCWIHLPMHSNLESPYPWETIRVLRFDTPKEVPDAMSRMVNLEELTLQGGEYQSLPASLKNLTKLWKLELTYYNYPSYSQGILEVVYLLGSLRYLNLRGMNAWIITENIQYLPDLEYLNLSLAGLKEISSAIGTLTRLSTLLISDIYGGIAPDITSLPPEIVNLKNLEYLDVSATSVTLLPDQIFRQGVTVRGLKGANT